MHGGWARLKIQDSEILPSPNEGAIASKGVEKAVVEGMDYFGGQDNNVIKRLGQHSSVRATKLRVNHLHKSPVTSDSKY